MIGWADYEVCWFKNIMDTNTRTQHRPLQHILKACLICLCGIIWHCICVISHPQAKWLIVIRKGNMLHFWRSHRFTNFQPETMYYFQMEHSIQFLAVQISQYTLSANTLLKYHIQANEVCLSWQETEHQSGFEAKHIIEGSISLFTWQS